MKKTLALLYTFFTLLLCQITYANSTGLLFNVTTQGAKLSIKSVKPNHTYSQAGIKVTTPGYSLKNPGTECTAIKNGYCLFSTSDTTPATISITGPTGAMNAELCLNGLGPLSCQNYNNISLVSAPQYIYIVSAYNVEPVSLCALNPTSGAIESCQDAGGESFFNSVPIQGIVLNNLGTIAYLSNASGSPSDPYVYQCQIDPVLHTFSSCSTTTVITPSGYTPYEGMLAINSTNTMTYLTDNAGRIVACPITGGVIGGNCADTGATNLSSNAAGIVINNAGTTAYIGNYNAPAGVDVCTVNGSTFSNCIDKTGGSVNSVPFSFQSGAGVALNNTEGTLYITDSVAQIIYGCSTTPSNATTFESCFVAYSGAIGAYNIVLNSANTVAYLTDYGTNAYSCPILSDGTFSTCTPLTLPSSTVGMALLY